MTKQPDGARGDEVDQNLDDVCNHHKIFFVIYFIKISNAVNMLKHMGEEIMEEAESQNDQIERITEKAEFNRNRIEKDVKEAQKLL